jgi:uncharacterized protein YecT (DUF1311 family)
MPAFRFGLILGGAIALITGPACAEATAAPDALARLEPGKIWDIVGVRIDTAATRTQAFGIDDPRLVGRRIQFTRTNIDTNADEGGCEQPRYIEAPLASGTAPGNGLPTTATQLGDYGITLPATDPVALVRIFCRPALGGGVYDNGTPFLRTGPTTALLAWNDLAMLELRLRSPDAMARPSFDCRHAASSTERAICGSFDLASLDTSMSKAYAGAVKAMVDYEPSQRNQLRREQRRWLANRSECNAQEKCLLARYAERIAAIMALQEGPR